jgi:hypothetical protein
MSASGVFLIASLIFLACIGIRHIGANMFDVKALQTEIEAEVAKEKMERAKKLLKDKLRAIDSAKQILANLEREKDDLLVAISEGNV